MSNMPAAREELIELAEVMELRGRRYFAKRVRQIVENYLHREPEISRAAPDSAPVSEKLALKVQSYHRRNPNTSQRRIGEIFDIAPGTVSKILNDKWDQ